MTRKILFAALFTIIFCLPAFGQTTSVSGTVTDTSGQTWNSGNYTFAFYPSPINPIGPYNWSGGAFSPSVPIVGNLTASGQISAIALPSNTSIVPSGSQWTVTVCPAATASQCFSKTFVVTGPSMDISSLLTPPPPNVTAAVTSQLSAYQDSEISGAKLGTTYYNLLDSTIHVCTISIPCTWVSVAGGGSGSGTVTPSPQFQLAYFPLAGTHATVQGIPITTDSNSDLFIPGTTGIGGPNPWVDTSAYGMRAVAAPIVATANCNSTSTVTFSSGSFASLLTGDGIVLYGCGATNTLTTPTAPTVTPISLSGPDTQNDTKPGPTGSTAYGYCLVARDRNGGLTKCSPAGTTSTGISALGLTTTTVSTLARSGNTVTVTTSSANNATVGGTVWITNSSDASFSGYYPVASVTPPFTFTYNQGISTLYGGSTSATGGTAQVYNGNHLSWTPVSGAWQYYVYNSTTGALLAATRPGENYWTDYGSMSYGVTLPDFVPSTAPSTATNDYLATTITAGGGTSSITLATPALQTISGVEAKLDNAPNFHNAWLAAAGTVKSTLHVSVPTAGLTYQFNSHLNLSAGPYIMTGGGCMTMNETMELPSINWIGGEGGGCISNTQFEWNIAQTITVGSAFPAFTFINPSVINHFAFSAPAQALTMTFSGGFGFNSQIENATFVFPNSDMMGQAMVEYGTSNTVARYDAFLTNDSSPYGYSLTPLVLLKDDTPGVDPSGGFSCEHCYFVGRTWGVDNNPTGGGGAVFRFYDTYAQANKMPMVMVGINGADLYFLDNVIGDTSSQPYFANMNGAGMSVKLSNMSNTSAELGGRPGMVTGLPIQQLIVDNTAYLNGQTVGQNFQVTQENGPSLCVNCINSTYTFDSNGSARIRGYVDMPLISNPGNPPFGYNRFYMDSTSDLFTCLETTGSNCAPSGGSSTGFQVNGTPLISSSVVNFTNSASFNGLTFSFSNPSNGVVQLGATGTLGNGGITNPSLTINSQSVTLGGSGNIPFQVNGVNNTSLAGLNLVNSTTNSVGLSVTFSNPGTNQARAEITGGTYTGTASALGATPSDCSGGQFATGIAANGNAICSTPAGGGNVSNIGTFGQFEPVFAANTTTTIASVPASLDASLQTGATADVKLNACNTGTVTAGIGLCDDRDLPGAQTLSATFTVGGVSGTSGVPETAILPSVAQWTTGAFTGGTTCGIFQFGLTNIVSNSPRLRMEVISGTGSGGLKALYCNDNGTTGGGSGHPLYYGLDGVTFYNPTAPTASNVGVLIQQAVDGSHFTNDDIVDPEDASALQVTGACCGAAMFSPVVNSEFTGHIPADWESSSSGTINDFNVFSPSFGHPAATFPVWKLNDTSSIHNSFTSAYGLYEELSNADSTTNANQLTGQGGLNVFGAELKSETASSTACAFSVSSAFASALNVIGISMVGGSGTFTYPACLASNANTGHTAFTDSHGYGSYVSSPFYTENLLDFGFNGFLNTYTTTHTLNTGENWVNMNCASACNVVVPHADTGQQWHVMSIGAGTATFAPDSGNISGSGNAPATTLPLAQNTGYIVSCDGTNCFAIGGGSGGSVGTGTQFAVTDWATTGTLGSIVGSITGTALVAQNGAAPIFTSPGIPGSTITTNTGYTVQCDSTTTLIDRFRALIFTNASGDTVTVPDAGSAGCGSNFTFVVGVGPGGGSLTVNRQTSSLFTILTGTAALASQTTFNLTAGQYATLSSPDNANYLVRITEGGGGSGGGPTLQTNGTNNSNQTILNLINSSPFNGLTATVTNTSGGTVQLGFSGTLGNAGLTNPATTVNGQTCTLGSTCTIPFQTNSVANTSQSGLNLTNSAATNGLTLTVTNSGTNVVQLGYTGTLNNSGLTNPSTTVNNVSCILGSTCINNPPFDKSTYGLSNPIQDVTFTQPSSSTTGWTFAGTAPASSSGATGTNATSLMNINGVTGGADSNATGTAGVGSSPTFAAGNGGAGTGTNTVGGAGGAFTFTAGNGGASNGTGANSNGGSVVFNMGAPGTGGSGAAGLPGLAKFNGTGAGAYGYAQGSDNCTQILTFVATGICEEAPSSGVTNYKVIKPPVAANGITTNNVSATVDTQGFSGDSNHSTIVTISSATSIGTTTLCSTGNCPAGTYQINGYIDVTSACTATGSYFVSITYTDDAGSKTTVMPLIGTGTTASILTAAGISSSLALSSTSNFAQGDLVIRSTGAAAISYTTTAGACGTGGPAAGKLYLSAVPLQ